MLIRTDQYPLFAGVIILKNTNITRCGNEKRWDLYILKSQKCAYCYKCFNCQNNIIQLVQLYNNIIKSNKFYKNRG